MKDIKDFTGLSDETCEALLVELFQSLPSLMQSIAPEGFSNSPLIRVYHPTAGQQYTEYKRMHENLLHLENLMKKPQTLQPLITFESFADTFEEIPVDEQYKLVSIFGKCLWKVFSNNHTIYNTKNEAYDLGSWRGSGGFIADIINKLKLVPDKVFDYIDFYMGGIWTDDRADLTPVYEFIFSKLKDKGLDWEYSNPRMGVVSFNRQEKSDTKPENYNPSKEIELQFQQQKNEEELGKLQQQFDEIYDQEYEEAKYKQPSPEVMAYFNVYGHWPGGYPLKDL